MTLYFNLKFRYPGGRYCAEDRFECRNHICVNHNDLCDGNDDCGDGSDESEDLCKNFTCDKVQKFQCNNFKCIPRYGFLKVKYFSTNLTYLFFIS